MVKKSFLNNFRHCSQEEIIYFFGNELYVGKYTKKLYTNHSDPEGRIFYPILTLMIDSYSLNCVFLPNLRDGRLSIR